MPTTLQAVMALRRFPVVRSGEAFAEASLNLKPYMNVWGRFGMSMRKKKMLAIGLPVKRGP